MTQVAKQVYSGTGSRDHDDVHAGRTVASGRSTSKTRKSAATRRRIMDAAAQLMIEHGNTAFQMSEISERCEMSKGAIYYYFADKEDLVSAVYDDQVDDLVRAIDTVVDQTDTAVEALRNACEEFATRASSGSPLAMAIVRELLLYRDGVPKGRVRRVHHIIEVVASQLERAKREGVVREDVDVELAAVSACGAFTFAAVSFQMRDDHVAVTSENFASELFDLLVHGIGKQ